VVANGEEEGRTPLASPNRTLEKKNKKKRITMRKAKPFFVRRGELSALNTPILTDEWGERKEKAGLKKGRKDQCVALSCPLKQGDSKERERKKKREDRKTI